jgi:hypothetical protein
VEAVHTVGSKFFKTRRTRTKKLSDSTLKLMKVRRGMIVQSSGDVCEYWQLNRQLSMVAFSYKHFSTSISSSSSSCQPIDVHCWT